MLAPQQKGRRLVLFVGGFDPRGARHYHQLMRKEAVKQSEVVQVNYQIGSRQPWVPGEAEGLRHAVWTVSQTARLTDEPANVQREEHSVAASCSARTDYVFIEWSDIVRSQWPKHTWQVWLQAWATYAAVFRGRASLPPLRKEVPYVLWTLAYPLVYMLLCLVLAIMAGVGIGVAGAPQWGTVGSILLGTFGAAVVLLVGYRLDQLVHVSWLLRILTFARIASQHEVVGLQERLRKTAQVAAEQMHQGAYQELVVVGFSVGSAVALPLVQMLREYLQAPAMMSGGSSFAAGQVQLLTLGNCIPLFTLMPAVQSSLREQLLAVAQDTQVQWIDISAPSDSVSFGLCRLLPLSLQMLHEIDFAQCINPRYMCSPRFHKLFRQKMYHRLRRNKMRMHFQYLMAAELPGAYDYFALLTAEERCMDFIIKRLVR